MTSEFVHLNDQKHHFVTFWFMFCCLCVIIFTPMPFPHIFPTIFCDWKKPQWGAVPLQNHAFSLPYVCSVCFSLGFRVQQK